MTQSAMIIAHGQPSDPGPAEADLARLARRVAAHLPGWRIGSATLAAPGALDIAVKSLGPVGLAFPMFMAGGWFTRVQLPAKLSAVQGADWRVLEPLGCHPALHDLAVQMITAQAPASVVLAAHGSFQSAVPADIALHVAESVARSTGIRTEAAFIDQSPRLSDISPHGRLSICLPFFAASGSHVTDDIPAALAKAGFQGRILPALGLAAAIPALIARAIAEGQPVCTSACRWQREKPASAL